MSEGRPVLYVIVCAAAPAKDVGYLAGLGMERGWDVQIVATPSALDFFDVGGLEAQTGRAVRSEYRKPSDPKPPRADAIIVAPATYNTVNKWANGICDTYALGLLAEAPGLGIPVVALPFVNAALAGRRAFQRSVGELRDEGVRILFGAGEGAGENEPHPPGAGGDHLADYPWASAVEEVEQIYRALRACQA